MPRRSDPAAPRGWARASLVLIPPLVAATVALLLFRTDYLASYENRLYDLQFRLRGHEGLARQEVVIVAIDDASLAAEGAWPWPRRRVARLLERIKQGAPRTIGLDLLVDLPEAGGEGDAALAAALNSPPATVLSQVLGRESDGGRPVLIQPLARFVTPHSQPAAVNLEPDPTDARVRRFRPDPGASRLSFPVALALAADGLDANAVAGDDAELRVGRRRLPLDRGLALINFTGSRIDAISAADVLADFFDPSLFFPDRIVLVGRTDRACKDFFNTPVPGEAFFATEHLAGVEIWKEALDTLLQDRGLRQPPLPPIVAGILAAAIILSALMLARPAWSSVFLVASLAAWLLLVHLSFTVGRTHLPIMPGVMTFYFTSILSFLRLYRTQARMKRLLMTAFADYVSPQVLDRVLEPTSAPAAEGERRTLTVLVAGLADTAPVGETRPPAEVAARLRSHFSELARLVREHGGGVHRTIGGVLVAAFGAAEGDDHALRAVRAAGAMRDRRPQPGAPDETTLPLRIGIGTGTVVLGSFGPDRRGDDAIFGRPVDLALRLSTAAAPGAILVSEATWEQVRNRFPAAEPLRITPAEAPAIRARAILGAAPPADSEPGKGGRPQ